MGSFRFRFNAKTPPMSIEDWHQRVLPTIWRSVISRAALTI
jgi:hypothetical protein